MWWWYGMKLNSDTNFSLEAAPTNHRFYDQMGNIAALKMWLNFLTMVIIVVQSIADISVETLFYFLSIIIVFFLSLLIVLVYLLLRIVLIYHSDYPSLTQNYLIDKYFNQTNSIKVYDANLLKFADTDDLYLPEAVIEVDLGIPNTFVWSPDNKNFYFTDTLNGKILSYNFELESGELSNKKDFAQFERGHPDGSTIDTDGCIWNCRWGGSCIVRFTPTGHVDQIIEMPVQNITNCVFGGRDLKTLFVTTASNKLSLIHI